MNELTKTRLKNMQNIKAALDAESAANSNRFMNKGIAGLEEQKNYWQSNQEQRNAYDDVERETLRTVGINTFNRPIRLTMTNRGGKRRTKRRHNNKKRRHSKKKRYFKRKY